MGSTLKGKNLLLYIERICSYKSKFFPLRVDPTEKGGKNIASPVSIPIHLKTNNAHFHKMQRPGLFNRIHTVVISHSQKAYLIVGCFLLSS